MVSTNKGVTGSGCVSASKCKETDAAGMAWKELGDQWISPSRDEGLPGGVPLTSRSTEVQAEVQGTKNSSAGDV